MFLILDLRHIAVGYILLSGHDSRMNGHDHEDLQFGEWVDRVTYDKRRVSKRQIKGQGKKAKNINFQRFYKA